MENRIVGNISNLDVCYSSVALSINFNSKTGFHDSKICRNCKPPKNLDQNRNKDVIAQTAQKLSLFFLLLIKHKQTSKMIRFHKKKSKTLHKYCLAAIGRSFSSKFVLEGQVKNRVI